MSPPFLACELTPSGRGAVAAIGVRGELGLLDSFFRAANSLSASAQPANAIRFGRWGDEHPEEVVFVRTGDNAAEVHCHGGVAAAARILDDVRRAGGTILSQSEWLARTSSLWEAECRSVLAACLTLRTSHLALRQCQLLPAAISEIERGGSDTAARIADMLRWAEFGCHLSQPWSVVLCGRPNVGKSSLINALVGFARTIVFDQPGTTRDVVSVDTAFDGWPVRLSDTAGLRETSEQLESAGIARARQRMREADLLVVVLEATAGLTDDDRSLLAEITAMSPARTPVVVWNKCDLAEPDSSQVGSLIPPLAVAATAGAGIPELMQRIVLSLVPETPPADAAFPVTDSQRVWLERLAAETRFN